MYLSLIFIKVIDLGREGCNFIQKETRTELFSWQFYEVFKNTFL